MGGCVATASSKAGLGWAWCSDGKRDMEGRFSSLGAARCGLSRCARLGALPSVLTWTLTWTHLSNGPQWGAGALLRKGCFL